jgi:folate-dependent phosphoribosylglycinamide formyltransferase PurN
VNELFRVAGHQICLVILSDRFRGRRGGAPQQFFEGVRRSGLSLTLWLGFDIVAARIIDIVGGYVCRLGRRPTELRGARTLARAYGAKAIECVDVNAPSILDVVASMAPDAIVVMNFDQILHEPLIAVAKGQVLNVHPSLLPALRGPCPAFWALAEKHQNVGATVHLIEDRRIDAGPILDQRVVILDTSLSVAEATCHLFEMGVRCLPVALERSQYGEHKTLQPSTGANYRSFPTRSELRWAHKRGVRLYRLFPLLRLLGKALRRQRPGRSLPE